MSERITTDEWLAELEKLSNAAPVNANGYMTTQEITKATKHSQTWVLARLKELIQQGLVEVSTRRTLTITGRPCNTPVYRLKKGKAS